MRLVVLAMYEYDMHMKRVTYFLPEPLLARLRKYAERHDLSVSDVIRRAILRFLDEEEPEKTK